MAGTEDQDRLGGTADRPRPVLVRRRSELMLLGTGFSVVAGVALLLGAVQGFDKDGLFFAGVGVVAGGVGTGLIAALSERRALEELQPANAALGVEPRRTLLGRVALW